MRIEGSAAAPTLVFLHEGLGSLSMWRDFPQRVAAATLCPALVYSRAGYGRSSPLAAAACARLHARRSADGASRASRSRSPSSARCSSATATARRSRSSTPAPARRPVRGVIALAPHVFVEALSIARIARAREHYAAAICARASRGTISDVDSAFRGWNDIWLSPRFRDWNIEDVLASIECPVLLIQGRDDEYGTLAQLDAIERARSRHRRASRARRMRTLAAARSAGCHAVRDFALRHGAASRAALSVSARS